MVSCLVSATVAAIGCDGRMTARGTVVNEDSDPIEGARVVCHRKGEDLDSMTSGTRTRMTDKSGKFSLGTTHAPGGGVRFVLTVTKTGYERHTQELRGSKQHKGLKIVLKRRPPVKAKQP